MERCVVEHRGSRPHCPLALSEQGKVVANPIVERASFSLPTTSPSTLSEQEKAVAHIPPLEERPSRRQPHRISSHYYSLHFYTSVKERGESLHPTSDLKQGFLRVPIGTQSHGGR